MKITEKAKQMFLKLLEDNGSDTLEIQIASSSCCGNKSIRLNLVNASECARAVEYDGLRISVSEDEEKELKKSYF